MTGLIPILLSERLQLDGVAFATFSRTDQCSHGRQLARFPRGQATPGRGKARQSKTNQNSSQGILCNHLKLPVFAQEVAEPRAQPLDCIAGSYKLECLLRPFSTGRVGAHRTDKWRQLCSSRAFEYPNFKNTKSFEKRVVNILPWFNC